MPNKPSINVTMTFKIVPKWRNFAKSGHTAGTRLLSDIFIAEIIPSFTVVMSG